MKYIIFIILICIPIFGFAQQSIVPTGGNAFGSSGTAAYSVGQVAWHMFTGTNGTVVQGMQQPYEISVISGIDDYNISLNYIIYPNPTRGNVILNTGETDFTGMKYQIFSVTGIMFQEKQVETAETEIVLDTYPSGTYLLRVLRDQIALRIFKIVKN